MARLTARQNAGLHGHLAEVLQLAVDVKVAEAAVEAGAVLPGGLAQGCGHVVLAGHACGGTPGQCLGPLGEILSNCPPPNELLQQGGSQGDNPLGQPQVIGLQACGSPPVCTLESPEISGELLMPGTSTQTDFIGLSGQGGGREKRHVFLCSDLFFGRCSRQF